MSNIVHLRFPVTLLGRWRSDEDDARSEYVISQRDGQLTVSAFDFIDGEPYEISNVEYDQETVTFETLMPSTGRSGQVVLKATPGATHAVQTFTFTDTAILSRLPR
jgi:hypothetical protein